MCNSVDFKGFIDRNMGILDKKVDSSELSSKEKEIMHAVIKKAINYLNEEYEDALAKEDAPAIMSVIAKSGNWLNVFNRALVYDPLAWEEIEGILEELKEKEV